MTKPTLPERLTEQFYAWELRGRGWQEFPSAVALEPPYVPFPGYFLPPIKDDGHRPGLLGRLLAPARPAEEPPELEEAEPEAFENDEPLIECVVSLPRDEAVKAESAERFLLSLSGAELPLAFEVVGLSDQLRVQIVSRAPDSGLLANQLRAFFPEVSISGESEVLLQQRWTRTQGETVLVHFGLAREFMLPLASFRSLDPDPLLPLFGALSELEPGEAALVQVLFARVRERWAESVMRAVVTGSGEPFFADYPELTKAAREKVSRPLYAACLRVAAKSSDATGAWRIVRDLAGALTHFGAPGGNELLPLAFEEGDDATEQIFERVSRRPGMIVGSDELAALAHLPSASVRVWPRVRVPEMAAPLCVICTVAGTMTGCLLRQAGPAVTVWVEVPLHVPATLAGPAGAVGPAEPPPQPATTSMDSAHAARIRIRSLLRRFVAS